MRKTLAINRLCLDFQRPENLIETRVEELVMQMRRGEKAEPVTVCFDGTRYLLKDGFHRVEAARRRRGNPRHAGGDGSRISANDGSCET